MRHVADGKYLAKNTLRDGTHVLSGGASNAADGVHAVVASRFLDASFSATVSAIGDDFMAPGTNRFGAADKNANGRDQNREAVERFPAGMYCDARSHAICIVHVYRQTSRNRQVVVNRHPRPFKAKVAS